MGAMASACHFLQDLDASATIAKKSVFMSIRSLIIMLF
jgi:hypothetical protein